MSEGRPEIYDQIGGRYAGSRRPDPRWAARINDAVRGSRSLVNVGAGTGSYEPELMSVVAVEPSETMIRQRPVGSASVVRAEAEQLPFPDKVFDTALAVLTVHHWVDAHAGLREMCRVSHRQIVVTWDPRYFSEHFWLIRDYLPEVERRERELATLTTIVDSLETVSVEPLLVPSDCVDGFLGAYWKRPESYLDPSIRAAMSGLALIDQDAVQAAADRLRGDIVEGRWRDKNADVLDVAELDLGYRIVRAGE